MADSVVLPPVPPGRDPSLLGEALPPATRIIGGTTVITEASPRGHPFPAYVQLRVRVPVLLGVSYTYFTCGGCIVHAWRRSPTRRAGFWVATAAHCLDTANIYEVNLWVGGVQAGMDVSQKTSFYGGQSNNASGWRLLGPGGIRIYRHPAFSSETLIPDVALLRVLMPDGEDLPATLLDPETGSVAWSVVPMLGLSSSYQNMPATIVGFGKTSASATSASFTLQQADAVVEPTNFSWNPHPTDRLFYHWVVGQSTLDSGTLASTCSGDSGGPLLSRYYPNTTTPPILMGVLCCGWCRADLDMRRYPSMFTRLQPFLGAPSADYSVGLAEDSVWRGGILRIIADNSPVQIRTNVATPAGDAAASGPWNDANEWIEEEYSPPLITTDQLVAIAIIVGVGIVLALVALRVVTRRRRKPDGRQPLLKR